MITTLPTRCSRWPGALESRVAWSLVADETGTFFLAKPCSGGGTGSQEPELCLSSCGFWADLLPVGQ